MPNLNFLRKTVYILVLTVFCPFITCRASDWKEVQKLKLVYIKQIAAHAMEQQKRSALPEIPIIFPASFSDCPKMKLLTIKSNSIKIKLTDIYNEAKKPVSDAVRFAFDKPLNLLDQGSGITILIRTDPNSSREIRLGIRFKSAGGNKTADILPFIPIVNNWGDDTQEIYFDWSFINYRNVNDAIEVLKHVEAIEFITSSVLRAPERGLSKTPQSGTITISNMKLVDYLKGSYDPARHSWKQGGEPDLTLQQRCQEVTGVVATYGGEDGIKSAIESLDLCVRTQCWDGSFLDGRRGAATVTSGR